MLSRKTVFVLGAGASAELKLPVGETLKSWIADALALDAGRRIGAFSDEHVETAVLSYVYEEERNMQPQVYREYEQAATVISKALPFALSIDQYLDSQRANPVIVNLGKIGIASSILKAERQSIIGNPLRQAVRLQGGESRLPAEVRQTWHLKLVQLLTAGKAKEDLDSLFNDVAFIVFNYDRCLEHYLTLALSRYYGTEANAMSQVLSRLEIVHPYGQVGNMPWQGGTTVPFGGEAEGQLRNVARSLLTFTESAQSGVTEQVKSLIETAETVVFMGFGYLPQNVELLTARFQSNAKRVFYTTYGVSRSDSELVEIDLQRILQKEAANPALAFNGYGSFEAFEDAGRCSDLMNNNWMRLTREPLDS
ncbi:hypothetical protein [Sphingomonas sp. Leaf10]|uniref:hypothetical protein n=1 Tax=Sphingomonas sp. Leaf10 TaxID=1735676 RepID=UPI000A8309C8|nr:hypothetical protein [Sphingomonas sp. Leaf10]